MWEHDNLFNKLFPRTPLPQPYPPAQAPISLLGGPENWGISSGMTMTIKAKGYGKFKDSRWCPRWLAFFNFNYVRKSVTQPAPLILEVVSLSKNINPSLVLVQPRKTRPFITERLLMGHKESNQTNKHTFCMRIIKKSSDLE